MKRFFFVFLFALTALFFSACSSSDSGSGNADNPPAPQNIAGKVIIPSAYNTGYVVQVCGDANNSNSCDSGETIVNVTTGSGEFSVTTRSDYPLVAEFYPASATSGTSVSVLNGHLPVLVYTTPAGENTISAFTTMVKNKVDTQPGIYNAISGADKVKADTGITFDPFNAANYTANTVLHDKVSAVTAGILEYIRDTLNITPDTFSAGVILALYDVVYDIVATVAANPDSADVDSLIDSNRGSVDGTAIADANGAMGEVWNVGNTVSGIYEFILPEGENRVAVSSGDDDDAISLPTATLPSGSLNFSDHDITVKKATKASPKNILTSERFYSRTFNLGAGAEVYTVIFTQDFTKNVQSVEYLRQNFHTNGFWDTFSGDYADSVIPSNFDETFTITNITTQRGYDITFRPKRDGLNAPQNGDFDWYYYGDEKPFSYFPNEKHGSFVKIDDGDNEAFKLTATDGSAAILFKYQDEYSEYWVLATYPVLEGVFTFFNQAAAQYIIDQWKTGVTPRW
jgi:hypothetical protein